MSKLFIEKHFCYYSYTKVIKFLQSDNIKCIKLAQCNSNTSNPHNTKAVQIGIIVTKSMSCVRKKDISFHLVSISIIINQKTKYLIKLDLIIFDACRLEKGYS